MKLPKRKNNRLKDYDYSKCGYYFITICSKDKKHIFCNITKENTVNLSEVGQTIDKIINLIPSNYLNIKLPNYIIMPNHVHMIIAITKDSGRSMIAPTTISKIVQQFKGRVT